MNDYAREVQQCADASARTSERTIAKLSAERDAALAWAKDQHAVADRYAAQLTAALDAVEQARADGYVQGLRDGEKIAMDKASDMRNGPSSDIYSRAYASDVECVAEAICALIPAEPTPAPAGTTKGGTE